MAKLNNKLGYTVSVPLEVKLYKWFQSLRRMRHVGGVLER